MLPPEGGGFTDPLGETLKLKTTSYKHDNTLTLKELIDDTYKLVQIVQKKYLIY